MVHLKLLAEAGYHGERIVFVSTPQLPTHNALAQVAVAALRQAGMNADLQMGDWPVVLQRINTRSRSVALTALWRNAFNAYWNIEKHETAAG